MRPISGGFDPYRRSLPPTRGQIAPAGSIAPTRQIAPLADAAEPHAELELSVRLLADGGSIAVRRRVVTDAAGVRHTVGIDALIR